MTITPVQQLPAGWSMRRATEDRGWDRVVAEDDRDDVSWLSADERRWRRANEADAAAARRRAPVSARARRWDKTRCGPGLAALLAETDVASLSDDECVVFAQAVIRQQSWTDSMLFDVSARFVEHRPGPDDTQRPFGFPDGPGVERRIQLGGQGTRQVGSFATAEWAAALKTSRGVATRLVADTLDVTDRLPMVWMHLRAGQCDTRRVRMIADRTRFLEPRLLALVEDAITSKLATITRPQLDRIIDQLIATHDPGAARDQVAAAKKTRDVWFHHCLDDHADIVGTLDGIGATVLDRRLDQLATLLGRVQRTHGEHAGFGPDDETRAQRRARALVLLATPTEVARLLHLAAGGDGTGDGDGGGGAGGDASGESASGDAAAADACAAALNPVTLYVHLRADGTLDLEGLGILSLPTVRDLLGTGVATVRVQPVIDLNATYRSPGYHPGTVLREQTVLINQTCRFPFCQRPARECDYEHPVPWPRGPTESGNAGSACRGHHNVKTHNVKTHSDWRVHQPAPGIYIWQAPTGHVYTVTPDGTHAMS